MADKRFVEEIELGAGDGANANRTLERGGLIASPSGVADGSRDDLSICSQEKSASVPMCPLGQCPWTGCNCEHQHDELRQDIRSKADAVYDAHSHRTLDEIEEQLHEHLGDEFPHAPLGLIDDVIAAVMASNIDPAPYCSYGHRTKPRDCGPIAENE